nr:myotubularin-related protein 6-like [Biomphalaria glabrata]
MTSANVESPTGEADRLETFNGPPGPHIIALSGPVLTAPTTTTEELRRFLVSLHTTLSREVGNFLDGGQQQSQESGILKKVVNDQSSTEWLVIVLASPYSDLFG